MLRLSVNCSSYFPQALFPPVHHEAPNLISNMSFKKIRRAVEYMQLYTINESFHLLIDHELIFTLALEYPFVFNSFFRRNIFFWFSAFSWRDLLSRSKDKSIKVEIITLAFRLWDALLDIFRWKLSIGMNQSREGKFRARRRIHVPVSCSANVPSSPVLFDGLGC